jgi:DNA-binding transcriptional regulator YdaS (Cro superfamily)
MQTAAPADTPKNALNMAIALCGGQAALARLLSRAGRAVSQQRIWNAVHRDQSIPAEWCLPIERATGGRVTCRQLRPDLYPGEAR